MLTGELKTGGWKHAPLQVQHPNIAYEELTYITFNYYGFMPGKSTTDALFALRVLTEKYREGQKEMHFIFKMVSTSLSILNPEHNIGVDIASQWSIIAINYYFYLTISNAAS